MATSKKPVNPKGTAGKAAGPAKAKAKASTSYSPKPMSANDKKAAGFRGAITQYQINLKKKDVAAAKAKLKKDLKPLNNDKTSKAPKKPLVETNRIGGIISVLKKPKKEIS